MTGLYDLHTHSILSDGEMLPIELVRRMAVTGYTTVAVTDHADIANALSLIKPLLTLRNSAEKFGVTLLCGIEITHVPPGEIAIIAKRAKNAGADIVLVHGETPVEPVAPGTNRAACSCDDVDVLAHPGLILPEEADEARGRGIALEITSRAGHNRANGHVAAVARAAKCALVVNSDTHAPGDILGEQARYLVARGSGLNDRESRKVLDLNIEKLLAR
jgi:histidinol phosphatase-like PHP family hydrolase